MSDLSNPLFENQREFLERQKEEYKHALMGDVDQIKNQGQEIGKKAALAGGVLVAGLLIKRLFSSSSEKKEKKTKRKKKTSETSYVKSAPGTTFSDYDSYMHEQEDAYTLSSERMHHAEHEHDADTDTSDKKSFFNSNLGKVLTTQVVTLAMIYVGKKVEEYLNDVSENNDIAKEPVVVTEIETTEFIIPEKDAL
jgi:hypothetical protein